MLILNDTDIYKIHHEFNLLLRAKYRNSVTETKHLDFGSFIHPVFLSIPA